MKNVECRMKKPPSPSTPPTGSANLLIGTTARSAARPRKMPIRRLALPAPTRWKCTCAYDGGAFAGWQSQRGGNAIQDIIETRLREILGADANADTNTGANAARPIRIHASGRTDAGVHARAQVFHFDADWKHGPEKLRAALRGGLPPQIQIKTIRAAAPGFHARFSATGKRYTYHIHLGDADPFTRPYAWCIERPPDLAAMQAAAKILRGTHDFRAFSALNGPPKENTIRTLRRLDIAQRGRRLRITAEADGFMYKMVRSLVGALVAVGDGKLTPEDLRALLQTGKRTTQIQTAPSQGLFLDKVFY